MNKKLSAVFLLMAFRTISFASELTTQRIARFELMRPYGGNLLMSLGIPMGLESYVSTTPVHDAGLIKFKDASVSEILDRVVPQIDSEWHEDAGVINIFPRHIDKRTSYFLNRVVDINPTMRNREDIIDDIFRDWSNRNPAIRVEADSNDTAIAVTDGTEALVFSKAKQFLVPGTENPATPPRKLSKHTLPVKGKTLREVLNEIARREKVAWSAEISRPRKGKKEEIELYFSDSNNVEP